MITATTRSPYHHLLLGTCAVVLLLVWDVSSPRDLDPSSEAHSCSERPASGTSASQFQFVVCFTDKSFYDEPGKLPWHEAQTNILQDDMKCSLRMRFFASDNLAIGNQWLDCRRSKKFGYLCRRIVTLT